MQLKIAVLPGDGIGPEVTRAAVRALRTVAESGGHKFEFSEYPVGGTAIRSAGSPLPQATLDACLDSNAVLLGAVGDPEFDHVPRDRRPETGLLQLRAALGGFANLRPAKAYAALHACSPLTPEVAKGADLLVVRELLGGLYFGEPRGWDADIGEAWNTMRYTEGQVARVARIAFDLARGRKSKVASVDKANVLECSQLWRRTVIQIAQEYPQVKLEHYYVDAFAMHLVMNPGRFDVVLTENLFGDILSDEAAAITGSLGMLPSASIGGAVNLYEPVHGSAPDIAGRDMANPLGAIASAAMLLRHSAGLNEEADAIDTAICRVLDKGYRTADIRRSETEKLMPGSEMGKLVEQELAAARNRSQSHSAV